jgi:hypothetical protein
MLTDQEIIEKLAQLRKTKGKIYAPLKYFRGLKFKKDVETRYTKMLKKDFKPFKTDKNMKTKPSSYTIAFKRKYPGISSLNNISKVTKIPLKTLKIIYDRGLAAWRTGHRPGASPQAWAYARVYSYVMKGKTYHTANKNLHK